MNLEFKTDKNHKTKEKSKRGYKNKT